MEDAARFLKLWPEVKTVQVAFTTKDANPPSQEAGAQAGKLAGDSGKAQGLLDLANRRNAHFFIRPEHPSAILVDLDHYDPAHEPAIKHLKPRCIVRTSAEKRHAWY